MLNNQFLKVTTLLSLILFSNAIIDEETMRRKLAGEPLYESVARTEEELEETPLIQQQFVKIVQHTTDENLVLLDEIQLNALRCRPDSCSGPKCTCNAVFCKTNTVGPNTKPENFPTFNQVTDSDFCHSQQKLFDLNDIYDEVITHDSANGVEPLPIELIVLDQGYTKAPERLAVPLKVAQPTKKIVSNAQPLTQAITMCDNVKNSMTRKKGCNLNAVKDMVGKVINLLCRDTSGNSDGCVLVLNSEASDSLEYLDMTGIPIAYVYGPSQLVLSNYPIGLERSSCNKYKRNKPLKRKDVIKKKGYNDDDVPTSVNCAAAAASNMEKVLHELKKKSKRQHYAVNTLDLPFALEKVINDIWGATLTPELKETMLEKSKKDMFGIPFNKFLQLKGEKMDDDMKKVALEFMEDIYDELELEDDDEDGDEERRLGERKKKVRMTDWASNN